ncbi:outer membrane beta-barrel protein [Vibrio metschnikovii]|uniref:outer membrane beta-barrel protein n=1 Tax=Vibrio metschnikovii TaxID=28172 RepID=UPI00164C2D6C|nr:outer membrane beta-barrel protein [Vibrio metschnikovii]MBC5830877.1 outer membrane beta-barrel protein [Vibrio metschnikovii]
MKINKTFAVATVACGMIFLPLSTASAKTFIGLDNSYGSYSVKSLSESSNSLSKSNLRTKAGARLFVGNYLNDNIRVYAYLQGDVKSDYNSTYYSGFTYSKLNIRSSEYGLGADYLYPINNTKLYAVGGVSLGRHSSVLGLDLKEGVVSDSKQSGLTTGINLGMGYKFTDHFNMEAGARQSYLSGNKHTLSGVNGEENAYSYSFKSASQIYINLSYAF